MKQAYDLHTVHSTILQKEGEKTMSINYTTIYYTPFLSLQYQTSLSLLEVK